MLRKTAIILLLGMIFNSTGCAMLDDGNTSSQSDYEETKQMVVDVLQTEEGKKAIQEVLKGEEMREQLVMEQAFIKDTIQTTLASDKGREYWQQVMKDPEFAETFAKSMQEENEQLLKGLMRDPEYQGMMQDILRDPEMEEDYLELMQTKTYRNQLTALVTEAMESPLFVARVSELLQQIAREELKSGEGGQTQGGNGGAQDGNGGGGQEDGSQPEGEQAESAG
ncbi:spore germination lipoprotein GerD [Salipaludibacillus aurantiacus]|uniref:Spore germination protein D n=1 Tax=Salipaludibacillus aurantiacus TaxID=1601833 RepID=A0A1H9V335_9BACI|nr:spore germination lipoprotein GerD [Salipaludibacillus aurantiacus]SES15989.1 spore germination protein D [Salipaludibacillus aurantiacus]